MIIKIDDKIYDYDDNEKDIIWDKTGSQPTSKPDEFRLSKSKFCSGAQCPKMLWLKKYRPDLFDDSVINAAVIATGNDVGDLAMGLFGDYIEVPYDKDLSKMIEGTKELMNKGVENIAEASFTYGSYSIKYVLPALFPNDPALDYHNLEGVHNGGEAADTFLRMEKMTKDELERYRGYLLKYCGLDTFAMVKIWQKLLEVTNRTC